jgi:hypothetical protein
MSSKMSQPTFFGGVGSTTLCYLFIYIAESLGHFEFKTLLTLSSAFYKR